MNLEALASQVLCAKYFKGFDLLHALLKLSCSHILRSIGWERSLIANGLRWKVRDGNNIKVFFDQWLPRPSTFRTITPDPGSDLRVADLMDRFRRGWDSEKLEQHLLPVDRDVVRSIPVSWNGGWDYLCWHYD